MAELSQTKTHCVTGFVKGGRSNKDKSVTFRIAGQSFVVGEKSTHAELLQYKGQVLVQFEVISGNRNPRIVLILTKPSTRTIRQYMES